MDNTSLALRLTTLETRKLQTLQAKKRAYEVQRDALNNKIIETQAEYGAIYNRNSTLLSLPNEIVAQIFWFSIAVVQAQGTNDAPDDHPLTEVVVSHICKRWREIALSLPVIWSTFYYNASECPNPHASLTRLATYLSRSKHHLLELWLDLDPGTSKKDRDYDDGYVQLVKAILPHAKRWYRVTIWVDCKTDISLTPFQQTNAPHLIHLSLRLNAQDPDDYPFSNSFDDLQPMILCGGAPNLTSAFLDGWGFGSLLPPLNNITTLRIEENTTTFEAPTSQTAFFEVLALPALANLSIIGDVFELNADKVSWPPSIFMANLMHLRFSESILLMYTLIFLKAPLLETLVVKNIHGHVIGYLPSMLTATSFPSLRSLATHDCVFGPSSSGIFMCKVTAGITSLLVSEEDFDNSILFTATDWEAFPKFPWPNLKVAALNVGSIQDITICYSFVSRYPGEQPLTICVPEARVDDWKRSASQGYSILAQKCNIEELNDDNPIQPEASWPPGCNNFGIYTDDDNHFDVEEYYL